MVKSVCDDVNVYEADSSDESEPDVKDKPAVKHEPKELSMDMESVCDVDVNDSSSSDESEPAVQDKPPVKHKPKKVLMSPSGVPIFEYPPEKYSSHRMMQILLDPNIDSTKIAKQRPLETNRSATFIVDVRNLKHRDDIKKDMYGKWLHHGSHTDVFRCRFDEFSQVCVEKVAQGASGDNVFRLRRLHSTHPSNKHFRRIVSLITDSQNQPHHLCMVVYYVPAGFTPTVQSHGNSKQSKAFFPTLPSTLSAIKEQCVSGKGPKEVVSKVSAAVGGVQNVQDACELPRNEQQVTYMIRQLKKTPTLSLSSTATDELSVMHKAYMEDQHFIREVRTLREPAIVVATDQQLDDMNRFCCNEKNFGVLTVDPTFSLGDFDVTVTTYRHLLLECKRSGTHPAFIGPVMVHYRKTFSTYLFFTSTLVGLRQNLSSLQSFGTDGETALIQAFQHSFPSAVHLLCSIHVRRNIRDKQKDLSIPENVRSVINQDIFGKQVGSCHFEGLVDAKSDIEYEQGVLELTDKWKNLEDQEKGPIHRFVTWFLTYKKDVIQHGLLRSLRQKAGLGDPPTMFTTNASESVNAVIKSKVDYKKSELPVFLDKLKEVIDEQDKEVERAVIDRGKYQLSVNYNHLKRDEQQWFLRMSLNERKAHLKKVMNFDPVKTSCSRRLFTESNEPMHVTSSVQYSLPSTSRGLSLASSVSRSKAISPRYRPSSAAGFSKPCDGPSTSTDFIDNASLLDDDMTDNFNDNDPTFPDESSVYADFDASSSPTVESHIHALSVDVEELKSVQTPIEVLTAIWSKASCLVQEPNAVVPAPGCDSFSRMVKSSSGPRPHLVIRKKSGQFCCDNECPNWRSLGICSHSVAAAEDNKDLRSFVAWFAKAKKIPNITRLATTQMPAGRGRKGGVPPRKRRKTVPVESRKPFSSMLPQSSPNVLPRPVNVSVTNPITVSGGAVVTIGTQSIASMLPSLPPPLVHASPESSPDSTPFTLAFIVGNIRVCHGCRQRYTKPALPPHDLCVRHQEWQKFGPLADRQTRYGNVYYHCNVPCIQAVCSAFDPSQLQIPPRILVQLLPVHTEFLMGHMPGRL